jgi:hypothetical protein
MSHNNVNFFHLSSFIYYTLIAENYDSNVGTVVQTYSQAILIGDVLMSAVSVQTRSVTTNSENANSRNMIDHFIPGIPPKKYTE